VGQRSEIFFCKRGVIPYGVALKRHRCASRGHTRDASATVRAYKRREAFPPREVWLFPRQSARHEKGRSARGAREATACLVWVVEAWVWLCPLPLCRLLFRVRQRS
jgi:hypothetical protein